MIISCLEGLTIYHLEYLNCIITLPWGSNSQILTSPLCSTPLGSVGVYSIVNGNISEAQNSRLKRFIVIKTF